MSLDNMNVSQGGSGPHITITKESQSQCGATKEPMVLSQEALCMGCHKNLIEYETTSCSHKLFCRTCAMKCATGGKCKVCGSLYATLRRVFYK